MDAGDGGVGGCTDTHPPPTGLRPSVDESPATTLKRPRGLDDDVSAASQRHDGDRECPSPVVTVANLRLPVPATASAPPSASASAPSSAECEPSSGSGRMVLSLGLCESVVVGRNSHGGLAAGDAKCVLRAFHCTNEPLRPPPLLFWHMAGMIGGQLILCLSC